MHTIISLNPLGFDPTGKRYSKPRPNMGKSLLELPNDYIVLNLKTTGLDFQFDDIIEIAAIRVVNDLIDDSFSSLVRPALPIDDFVTAMTGITNEMLSNAPSISEILPSFLSFIGNSLIVSHCAAFHIRFIYDLCESLSFPPFSNDYVDILRLSKKTFKGETHYRLSDLSARFGLESAIERRALLDATRIYQCYCHIKNFIAENSISLKSKPAARPKRKIIDTNNIEIDESSPLFNRAFAFTGTLEKMTRTEAAQMVVSHGGIFCETVRKDTNFLVLGVTDYAKTNGLKSNKQKRAEQLRLNGNDIEIISENVFYDMLDL